MPRHITGIAVLTGYIFCLKFFLCDHLSPSKELVNSLLSYTIIRMLTSTLLLLSLSLGTGKAVSIHDSTSQDAGLQTTDCQLRCPKSTDLKKVILPAITQIQHETGEWENVLECWSVDTTTTNMPGVDNAFRLDWEGGFDAAYQYIFYGPSFMPPHTTPEPSLAIMSAGIGT